jgi:hypothetical protein
MACPYFQPVRVPVHGLDRTTAMLPLGDFWEGVCTAAGTASSLSACNLGYARGECPRFPDTAGPDAVRFVVRRDDGASLSILWVAERDHHPCSHGSLDYLLADAAFREPAEPVLTAQAQAYVQSYLRRKSEAAED